MKEIKHSLKLIEVFLIIAGLVSTFPKEVTADTSGKSTLYVAGRDPQANVIKIDAETLTILKSTVTPERCWPSSIAISPNGKKLYVGSAAGPGSGVRYPVLILDSSTFQIIGKFDLGGKKDPWSEPETLVAAHGVGDMILSPDGKKLVLLLEDYDSIIVNTEDMEIIRKIETPVERQSSRFSSDSRALYVYRVSHVDILDMNSFKVSEIPIPKKTEVFNVSKAAGREEELLINVGKLSEGFRPTKEPKPFYRITSLWPRFSTKGEMQYSEIVEKIDYGPKNFASKKDYLNWLESGEGGTIGRKLQVIKNNKVLTEVPIVDVPGIFKANDLRTETVESSFYISPDGKFLYFLAGSSFRYKGYLVKVDLVLQKMVNVIQICNGPTNIVGHYQK